MSSHLTPAERDAIFLGSQNRGMAPMDGIVGAVEAIVTARVEAAERALLAQVETIAGTSGATEKKG